MRASLDLHAADLAEASRAFQRTLAAATSQWNDSTRHAFDQRFTEPLLASGRKATSELADLARELKDALSMLNSAG